MTKKLPILAFLIIYAATNLLILHKWEKVNLYNLTGDEPHYIIIADSIINYRTFEVSKSYKKEFREGRIYRKANLYSDELPSPGNTHAVRGPNGLYSFHSTGLPLLVSVPYKVAGVFGVKVFLVMLGTLIPAIAWKIGGYFTRRFFLRFAATAVVCFGYPFIIASNQVYPEFSAGIILLYVLYCMIRMEKSKTGLGKANLFFAATLIGFLPWLQIKFFAPALIAILALIVFQIRLKLSKYYMVVPALIFLCAVALLAAYNHHAFGSMWGPYQSDALKVGRRALMVFLGLHLDRHQGILFQNPIFWLGPFFVASYLRENKIAGLASFAFYFSIVVPNAMHPNCYGGASFAGRFNWAGVVCMIPLLQYAINRFTRNFPRSGWAIIIICFILNGYVLWLLTDGQTPPYNARYPTFLSNYPAFLSGIGTILPAYYDDFFAFSFLPNYFWVFFLIAILLGSILSAIGLSRKILAAYALVSVTGCCVFLTVSSRISMNPVERIVLAAGKLPSTTGTIDGKSKIAIAKRDKPGYLCYGRYLTVPKGKYTVSVLYSASAGNDGVVGWIDMISVDKGGPVQRVAKAVVPGTSGEKEYFEMPFDLDQKARRLEVRFWYKGICNINLEYIIIKKIR